jgi:putative membrane protein
MQRHLYLLALPAAALVAAAGTACATGTAKPSAVPVPPTISPTISPTTRGQMSAQDRNWLTEIHQANLAEVEMGDIAQKKGSTPAVRSAGRTLATEHTDFDAKVTRVAGRLGVSLPPALAPADAAAANRLRGETGKTFDQDFLATMVSGHEKAIADTKAQIAQGSSPQVIALAKEALPDLRKHLAMLKKAQASG